MYSIKELSDIAGVSTRTLRWYESQGLLEPKRQANGYRSYGNFEVERLQQILYYRELGLELNTIRQLITAEDFDQLLALHEQLTALEERQRQTEQLIEALKKTIDAKQKGFKMEDKERFRALKDKALAENEAKFGAEIRANYGEAVVDEANARYAGLTEEQYQQMEELSFKLNTALAEAVVAGDPFSDAAKEIVHMHKQWLGYFWSDYTPEKHKGLAQMYVADQRFAEFYEAITTGAAEYLRDAIEYWA